MNGVLTMIALLMLVDIGFIIGVDIAMNTTERNKKLINGGSIAFIGFLAIAGAVAMTPEYAEFVQMERLEMIVTLILGVALISLGIKRSGILDKGKPVSNKNIAK